MKETKIQARSRTEKGSAAAGRLRRNGILPAVIYGKDRQPVDIQLDEHAFVMLLRSHKSESMILELELDGGKSVTVLLKALQYHPISGRVIHADFYEVSMTRRIEIAIQVHLTGTPVGVAQQGGMMEHVLREVRVECLPADVIEEVHLDVSGVHAGETLRVKDLQLDAGKYAFLDDPDVVIMAIAAPRGADADDSEEAAALASKGPEVIKEKKVEEE